MVLGDLIKKYRTEHELSMDDFSRVTGLSKAYISILERNYNPVNGKPVVPSLETIRTVSSAIGMDFNDVIAILDGKQPVSLSHDTNNKNINPEEGILVSDEQEISLVTTYRALSPSGKEKLLSSAKDINILDQYKQEMQHYGSIAADTGGPGRLVRIPDETFNKNKRE